MDLAFTYLTIAYSACFTVLGVLLLSLRLPKRDDVAHYKKSRMFFGAAYLLLGVTGVIELLLPTEPERSYATVFLMIFVSILHAWLNAVGYLLMLEPSRRHFRSFITYGCIALPIAFLSGALTVFYPPLYKTATYLLSALYVVQIAWMLRICHLNYLMCLTSLDNYDDGSLRFSWMNRVIGITVILAVFNLVYFFVPWVAFPLRLFTTLFYIYFAVHVFDYVPTFIYLDRAKEASDDREDLLLTNGNGKKIHSLVENWIAADGFCRTFLTIADVASNIGTNQTYLSQYINKRLGKPFQLWLNTLRIEKAKSLFREYPLKTNGEISKMVGFAESYNFSKWFKQIVGVSPNVWKKSLYLPHDEKTNDTT